LELSPALKGAIRSARLVELLDNPDETDNGGFVAVMLGAAEVVV
jgi:hypothetical protein